MFDEEKTEDGSDVSEGDKCYALEVYMAALITTWPSHPTAMARSPQPVTSYVVYHM